MFKIIVAINNKAVIGLNDTMPWHLPEDLKHFKNSTLNQNLVMGRITYENLPKKLEDRKVFIVSRQLKGEQIINNFDAFLKEHQYSDEVYFIGGGADIYKQALEYTDEIILSRINNDLDGDTFFPVEQLESFCLDKTVDKKSFTIEYYKRKGR